jgi:lysozyme
VFVDGRRKIDREEGDGMTIENQLVDHEGERLFPYVDCCGKSWRDCVCVKKGKLTIGVGRNIEDVGITQNESRYLLQNDIGRVRMELDEALPWWRSMDEIRQAVLIDLGFNLGVLTPPDTAKLLTFKQTLELIRTGQYAAAADRLATLPWHKQVGARALELEAMLRMPVQA